MRILTFDIEEWFHILDNESTKSEEHWKNYEYRLDANMDRIYELLDRNKQTATFFVLGWVARKFPHVLRSINDQGYEIATHSDLHQLAYEQNQKEFKEDLNRSIKSIEDVTGVKVKSYRAPGFSLKKENKWVFEELVKLGIETDCSIFPAERVHGGFAEYGHAEPSLVKTNSGSIKEFPINTTNIMGSPIVYSGGGYFRFFPYTLIDRWVSQSDYVMTYFHPRDFDPDQPVIEDLSRMRKFKSYYNLKGCLSKLEKLIQSYEFIDLRQANEQIDWNQVKTIEM